MDIRKIIHIDMDAFFASVEIRDNPRLRGKPVVVGGPPGTRSVICTASYEARRFGIHSAMSSDAAVRMCPGIIFIKPRMQAYKQASSIIHAIFHDYTDLVEPLSIDEAYLDVTVCKKDIPYATRMAREIRARIFRETGGLTASAGISYNKFLAKIGSDFNKPNGQTVILPEDAPALLARLPVEKFFGIGRVTAQTMHKMGIRTGADLRNLSPYAMTRLFGSRAEYYHDIARGIDTREVCPNRERKSLGTEITFLHDVSNITRLRDTLRKQSAEVADDLRKHNLCGKTVVLKVKYFDFRTITRSLTIPDYTADRNDIFHAAAALLKKTDAGNIPIRLIGVSVTGFPREETLYQPEFDFMKDLLPNPPREW